MLTRDLFAVANLLVNRACKRAVSVAYTDELVNNMPVGLKSHTASSYLRHLTCVLADADAPPIIGGGIKR